MPASRSVSVLILGGGVGGLVAAHRLRRALPATHRVVLVEREAQHVFAPSLLWVMTGQRSVQVIGHPSERLPNTLNVSFPGVRGSAVLAAAPMIAASTGSACHEGRETASTVLLAMGLEPDVALGAVRLSIGRSTTFAQVEAATRGLVQAYQRVA
jgi:cysteine sulfinate desulfinase/cysteine desulfurase-like protein